MRNRLKVFFRILLAFLLFVTSSFGSILSVQAESGNQTNWTDFGYKSTDDVNKEWKITFSHDVDESSVSKENIYVQESSGENVPIDIIVENDIVKFTPKSAYQVGETYQAYIGPDIKSAKGTVMKTAVKFTFTVEGKAPEPTTAEIGTPIIYPSVSNDIVIIDGNEYGISESVKGFFNAGNSKALENAQIEFNVKDGVIESIEDLYFVGKGTQDERIVLDGNGTSINGSVTVNGDYYSLNNLTIEGDLTLTDNVQNSFESNGLTVVGTTHVGENGIQPLSVASASIRTMQENPKTRVTIIFNDSTMATIEITKKDVYLEASGTTEITKISLFADSKITANENIIIPKVSIGGGATHVELNVTIKDVIIESNDSILVSGSGNFDNVSIDTNQQVSLNTTGQIKLLDAKNEESSVVVGENLNVGQINVPDNRDVKDIIKNYDEIEDQIGELPETVDYFAVGLLNVENRFGYAKLNIFNQGDYRLKYQQVEPWRHETEIPEIGEKAPSDSIEYTIGDEFIHLASYDVVVYLVDEHDTIIDIAEAHSTWYEGFSSEILEDNRTLRLKLALNIGDNTPEEFMEYIYFYHGENIDKFTDFSNVEWKLDDGIKTIDLELTNTFDLDKDSRIFIGAKHSHSYGSSLSSTIDNYKKMNLFVLRDLVQAEGPNVNNILVYILYTIAYEYNEEADGNRERISLAKRDSLSVATYKARFANSSVETVEDVKQIIREVNEELEAELDSLRKARNLVEELFVENPYAYPEHERLADDVSLDKITEVKTVVEALSTDFAERNELIIEVEYAERLLRRSPDYVEEEVEEVNQEVEQTEETE